ncbi:MAG: nucleotidyltransferase family protein [Candidatus Omnitrophica bacterium]|nr:nucleotidyltransferase family protein [Candidatus Omnitrophota bacterium]
MDTKKRISDIIRSQKCKEILKNYKVKKTALFGSYANGKNTKNSDIDLLVDFESGADLLDQVGLKMELEKLLKKKVDVVTRGGLSKYFKDSVIKQAVAL